MASDSDEDMFVTPPTSPMIHKLEDDDSTELAQWKMDIIDHHLEKLAKTIRNGELDYKRIEALKSTKAKRWKAKILDKKRKGDNGGRNSTLGVRSASIIEKKGSSRNLKPDNKNTSTSTDYAGRPSGVNSQSMDAKNPRNHSQHILVSNSRPSSNGLAAANGLSTANGLSAANGRPVTVSGASMAQQRPRKSLNAPSSTTQAKGSIPILLTSVSSEPLPYNPVLVEINSSKDESFKFIREKQVQQAEKLYDQVVTHQQTHSKKPATNQAPNSHTNKYSEMAADHSDRNPRFTSANGEQSYSGTRSTHAFQNQLPASLPPTGPAQNHVYNINRPYEYYPQQNFSYQLNSTYQTDPYSLHPSLDYLGVNNGAWVNPTPTAPQAYSAYSNHYHHQYPTHQYYSPVGDQIGFSAAQPPSYTNERISPPPPPPPREPSPPVIPPPPPPPREPSPPTIPPPPPPPREPSPPALSTNHQPKSTVTEQPSPVQSSTTQSSSKSRTGTKSLYAPTSAQIHSDAVLKKQNYQSPLATFGIQTNPNGHFNSGGKPATNQSLCIFEAEGGTCNDDTCLSKHFRDF